MSIWDERYSTQDYLFGEEPNDFLKNAVQHIPQNGRVLCLGEGEGRNAVFLAKQGLQVTALDISAVGLKKTRGLADKNHVEVLTVQADLENYALGEEKWDAVVSIWCHLPSSLRKKVHAQIHKALKHNGVFIIEAYSPEQLHNNTGGPKNPDLLASLEMLKADLSSLNLVIASAVNRDVQEGTGHCGMSSTLQLVARKTLTRGVL